MTRRLGKAAPVITGNNHWANQLFFWRDIMRLPTPRMQALVCVRFMMLMAALGSSSLSLYGQDSHYWNISYGTHATLLGGAVIGSARDLSATYYNPGLLALQREGGLLVGANVYTFQRIAVEGYQYGTSDQSTLAASPGMVAGRIPVDSTVLSGVAYSILGRQYFSAEVESRLTGTGDLYGTPGIPQQISAEWTFGTQLRETWLGLSLFRLVPPSLGIGLTNYVAVRSQEIRSSQVGGVIPQGDELTSAARVSNLSYYHVRLLWKLGIGVELDKLSLGATVTTPSLGIMGSGESFVHMSFSGMESASDTARTDLLAGSNQEELDSRFSNGWAVGVGVGYRFTDLQIHFSAEYYAPVSSFKILETAPFTGQSDGQQYTNPIIYEMGSVVNVGLGLEYALSPSTSIYGSVTTDFSGVEEGTSNTVSTTAWDLIHISAGTMLALESFDLTLGLSYAAGKEFLSDIPWTQRLGAGKSLFQPPDDTTVRTMSLTGVLAFSFRF